MLTLNIDYETGLKKLLSTLGRTQEAINKGKSKALRLSGLHMLRSIDTNFRAGGRPAWAPLKVATIARKGQSTILVQSGRLRKSVTRTSSMKQSENELRIGTNLEYAPVHQFGYPQKRIPKRAFLLFQKEDVTIISKIFKDNITGEIKAKVQ